MFWAESLNVIYANLLGDALLLLSHFFPPPIRDIGIDEAKDIRNLLHPLADEALDNFMGTVPSDPKAKPQQQAPNSGVPIEMVSTGHSGYRGHACIHDELGVRI